MEEMVYMRGRRQALDGPLPARAVRDRRPLHQPDRKLFAAFDAWCAHTDAAKSAIEKAEMHEKAEMFQAEALAAATWGQTE